MNYIFKLVFQIYQTQTTNQENWKMNQICLPPSNFWIRLNVQLRNQMWIDQIANQVTMIAPILAHSQHPISKEGVCLIGFGIPIKQWSWIVLHHVTFPISKTLTRPPKSYSAKSHICPSIKSVLQPAQWKKRPAYNGANRKRIEMEHFYPQTSQVQWPNKQTHLNYIISSSGNMTLNSNLVVATMNTS